MEVRVLGPMQVVGDDRRPIDIGGPRQRRLLSALALGAGTVVSDDRLVDAVWSDGETLPEHPRRALQTYVSRLRSVLGSDVIRTDGTGYALNDTVATDVARFERMASHARRAADAGDMQGAEAAIAEALRLWRGDAFEELADVDWADPDRRRLSAEVAGTRQQHVELLLANDAIEHALPEAEAIVANDPLSEGPRRALMLALYRSGRQADAIRSFQAYRRQLLEEAGLDPSTELLELERMILANDPRLDPEFEGRRIRGYQLQERIASGAFSDVYRGVQPSVGRDVAIKVVRPELADDPRFVRCFEAEAQLVAGLEHPHIVPIIDFWREPGNAYLVMRYLRGGSVAQRLDRDGPWAISDVVTVLEEVGSALALAHDERIVHGDVKPENVLFDEAGHSYLADFGTATMRERAGFDDRTSPFASPEQRTTGAGTRRSDIYALAQLVASLLAGRRAPDASSSLADVRPDVPDAVGKVLSVATSVDPARRYDHVDDFVDACVTALTGAANSSARHERIGWTRHRNPYRGMSAFGEADEALFFGRDELIGTLVTHVGAGRLVSLVGPSGSGKSSAVRAGLAPQLRADGAYVATITPGRHPMDELENALLGLAAESMPLLLEQLVADERGLARCLKRVLPDDGRPLVLVIDQLEDLFTLTGDDERRTFIAALVAALSDEDTRLAAVATIRADLLDRPLLQPGLGELVRDGAVLVTPLGVDELHRAIVGPAERCGLTVEPALVTALVGAVAGRTGALPLLQYTLTELFDRRDGATLTLAAYDDLGGIDSVVASRADEIVADHPGTQDVARRLFRRLVVPDDDVAAGVARQRIKRRDLVGVPDELVESFVQARLLTVDRDAMTREPTVEISHDALLTHWPRLRTWIDDDRDALRTLHRVGREARSWAGSGRADSELLRGGRLEAAEVLVDDRPDELSELEREFVDASRRHRDAVAEAERTRVRRLRTLLALVAAIALVAAVAGTVAWQQRGIAESEREAADVRFVSAESLSVARSERRLGLLMAVEAYRHDPSPSTIGAVQRVLLGAPLNWVGTVGGDRTVSSAAFVGPDRLVIARSGGFDVVDVSNRRIVESHDGAEQVSVTASAIDAARLALGTADGSWTLLDASTFEPLASGSVDAPVTAIAIDRDGGRLAVGDRSGALTLVEVDDPDAVSQVAFEAQILAASIDDDTGRVAVTTGPSAAGFGVTYVVTSDGELVSSAEVGAWTVGWSTAGLVAVSPSEAITLDAESGEVLSTVALGAEYGPTAATARLEDGIALLASDGTVEWLDAGADTAVPLATDPQVGDLQGLAIDPDGATVAVVGSTGVALFATDGSGTLSTGLLPGTAGVPLATIDRSAEVVVTGDIPGVASRWDLDRPFSPSSLEPYGRGTSDGDTFLLNGTVFDEDGEPAGVARALMRDGRIDELPLDASFSSFTFAISPDERMLAIDDATDVTDRTIRVVDLDTEEIVARLDALSADEGVDGSLHFAADLEFSPDGGRLVVTSWLGTVHVYDTATWEVSGSPLPPDDGFTGISFSADGEFALTHDWTRGQLARRRADTLEIVAGPVPAVQRPTRGGASPDLTADDRLVVVSGGTAGVSLYDVDTLEPIGDPFPFAAEIRQGSLAADAAVLATVTEAGAVLWDLDVDRWVDLACRAAGRQMTPTEWDQYGLGDDPAGTCPVG